MERAKCTLLIAALTASLAAACAANKPKPAPHFQPQTASQPAPAAENPAPPPVAQITCQQAGTNAFSILNVEGFTAQDVIAECERDWSQKSIDCFASATNNNDIQPCLDLNAAEASALYMERLNINLDATEAAAACYAGGDDALRMCQLACDDGFPSACVYASIGASTDALTGEWLARSCDVANELSYVKPADLPLSAADYDAELEMGIVACATLAAPLVADVVHGDATLLFRAEQACHVAANIDSPSAAKACYDYGRVSDAFGMVDTGTWAFEQACLANNAEACKLATTTPV
jgi:hypothetical protein